MPVSKKDPLFLKLESVSEQTKTALIKYRTIVAETRTKKVPPEKLQEHLAKARDAVNQQFGMLEDAVSASSMRLRQMIEADLNPPLSGNDALLAELHKVRLDAGLQSLFMAKANEGTGALIGAIDGQVKKFSKAGDWTGVQAVREQADNAIDQMDLEGQSAQDQARMKASILSRVDEALALNYTDEQQEAAALGAELEKGIQFATTAINYARFSVDNNDMESEVLLPTWTGDLLRVGPQQPSQGEQRFNDEMAPYRLPDLTFA